MKEEWEKSQEDDKIWWEEKEATRIEMAIKKREHDIATRKRLLRMKDDKDEFVSSILSQKVGFMGSTFFQLRFRIISFI